eukprot:COSAG02_NODE_2397_length_8951_cov_3.254406_4_plen_191_part_00
MGLKVCVNAGSTAAGYLHTHNIGFSIVESPGTLAMFASFWDEKCDAILYDAPLLEYNLYERTTLCAGSTCQANGVLVGQMRTQDPYGIILPEGHPAHEALSIASISRITAADFSEQLHDRWFPGEESEKEGGGKSDEDAAEVHFEWRFVVACAVGSACVTVGTVVHWYCYGWHTIKMRADVDEVPADTHE